MHSKASVLEFLKPLSNRKLNKVGIYMSEKSKKYRKVRRQVAVGMGLLIGILSVAHPQQTLTIAAYPALDEVTKAAIPLWKKKYPQVDIRVMSRPYAEHHSAMAKALSTSVGLPDVMAVEFGHLGRFAESDGLENLGNEPYSIRSRQLRFVPFAFRQAVNSSGEIVAVPSDIGPGTLLYRVDILKKAGVTEAELTESWDSYVAAGIKIKAQTGAYLMANARDIKDIVIRTDTRSPGSVAYWQPGQGLYINKSGKIQVDSPRFVRAFELAKKVRELKLDGQIETWSPEWLGSFKQGTVATQMSGAWLAGHLNNWIAPETRGQWRAAQLPEKAWGSWGGNFYAIPKGAKNKTMAWEFIQMLTLSPELQLSAFKLHDAFPALVAVHDDDFFNQPIPFLGGQQARILWREAASKVSPINVHKLDIVAEEIVNTEMDAVLDKGKPVAAALANARALLTQRTAQ